MAGREEFNLRGCNILWLAAVALRRYQIRVDNLWPLTFEEIGSEAGFVDGAIWNEFHPQLVGAGFDVIRLVVATEATQQWAVFIVSITDFQVVISATVMPLNLIKVEEFDVKPRRQRKYKTVRSTHWYGIPHLKGLEGKTYMVALSYSNLPYTHFVGPVVIRVVGRLDLAIVFLHFPTTDCCVCQ